MALMMTLDHPNIIKLYEVYHHRSSYIMVMELCEGTEVMDSFLRNKFGED